MTKPSDIEAEVVLNEGHGTVAFLDELGNAAELRSMDNASEDQRKHYMNFRREIRRSLEESKSVIDPPKLITEIDFRQFSDSVFYYAIGDPDRSQDLVWARITAYVAKVCAHLQLTSLANGKLLRGAIATGNLYFNKETMAGSPISETVALEKTAPGGAVVLSKSAESFIRNLYFRTGGADRDRWRAAQAELRSTNLFVYDDEGVLLVNPFSILISCFNEKIAITEEMIAPLYDGIRRNLHQFATEPHIYTKWAYIRDLFNSAYCLEVDDMDSYIIVPGNEAYRSFFTIDAFIKKKHKDSQKSFLQGGMRHIDQHNP